MDDPSQSPGCSREQNSTSARSTKRPMTRSSLAKIGCSYSNAESNNNSNKSSSGSSTISSSANNTSQNQDGPVSSAKQRRGLSGVSIPINNNTKAEPTRPNAESVAASTRSNSGASNSAPSSSVQSALTCLLCRDFYREPYSLLCGHSFCHECLLAALSFASKCPSCEREVRNADAEMHPNFSLSSIVDRYSLTSTWMTSNQLNQTQTLSQNVPEPLGNLNQTGSDLAGDGLMDLSSISTVNDVSRLVQQSPLVRNNRRLSLPASGQMAMSASEIDREIQRLRQMKAQLELQDEYLENVLVKEFLTNVKSSIEQQIGKLKSKLEKVTSDLDEVNACLRCVSSNSKQLVTTSQSAATCPSSGSNSPIGDSDINLPSSARASIRSMGTHFSDFEELYDRSSPCSEPSNSNLATSAGTQDHPASTTRRLASFRRALVQGTRYSGLKPIASIDFAMGTLQRTSCIVSSVAFNSRRDLFALAGVTKEIKVYDLASAIASNAANGNASSTPLVYPVTRMQNEKNKVSCIAWSPFHANQLGSTDYDGYVVVWDALRSSISTQWNEHDKRCWTIDWNKGEPDMLATGSDDFKVKIWKLNCDHSVNQIEWARSNVCTVDFHPTSRYYIVFGASDHNLYYFDLRQVRSPVAVMRGHTKAVSYAKFLSPNEICSASIDGTLRLWDVNARSCVRSYSGHTNEMNFVGLDTYSNYIVCGSETNEVFVYYKHLRRPLFTYKFPSDSTLPEPPNSFVSALAWNKAQSQPACLLAANSQGYAKLLEFETLNA